MTARRLEDIEADHEIAEEPAAAALAPPTVPSALRLAQDLGNARFSRLMASSSVLSRGKNGGDSDSEEEEKKPSRRPSKQAPKKRGGHKGEGALPVEVQGGRNRTVFHRIKQKQKGAMAQALGETGEISASYNVQRGSGQALSALVAKTKKGQVDRNKVLPRARTLAKKAKDGNCSDAEAAELVTLTELLEQLGNADPVSMLGVKANVWSAVKTRGLQARAEAEAEEEEEEEEEEFDVPSETDETGSRREDDDDFDPMGGGGTAIETPVG